jgi:NDP-sugar pyrophosphorylase family protein
MRAAVLSPTSAVNWVLPLRVSFTPDALRAGERIGGVILDGGVWRDIGNMEEYLRVHADLASGAVRIASPSGDADWPQWRMPGVSVGKNASLAGWNWLGPDCQVREGAKVENSVLWAGAVVESGARVSSSVVREGMIAAGNLADTAV